MRLRSALTLCVLLLLGGFTGACGNNSTPTTGATAKAPNTTAGATAKQEPPKEAKKEPPKRPMPKPFDAATAQLPFEATGAVAKVGDKEITAERFNDEARKLLKITRGNIPPNMIQSYKKNMIHRLVDEHLLMDAIAAQKIEVKDADVDAEYQKFAKRFPSPEQLKKYYETTGIKEAEVREEIKKRLSIDAFLIKKYNISVTDADVKKYYNSNKERFKKQAQVRARHILFKAEKGATDEQLKEAKKKADEVAKEAKAKGADFAALAKKHSQGPSGPNGGDLGYFPAHRMVKPFSEAAFKLKPGEISDPVRTQFGYHVIKVEDKKPESFVPFDEVKDRIEGQLKMKEMRDGMKKFLEEAKKGTKVELMEQNVKVNVDTSKAAAPPMFRMPHGHGGSHAGHNHGPGGHGHPKLKMMPKGGATAPAIKVDRKSVV